MKTSSSAGCFLHSRTLSWADLTCKKQKGLRENKVCSGMVATAWGKELFNLLREKGYAGEQAYLIAQAADVPVDRVAKGLAGMPMKRWTWEELLQAVRDMPARENKVITPCTTLTFGQ